MQTLKQHILSVPTHQCQQLALELRLQACNHQLHGIANFAHTLILGILHAFYVSFLAHKMQQGQDVEVDIPSTDSETSVLMEILNKTLPNTVP